MGASNLSLILEAIKEKNPSSDSQLKCGQCQITKGGADLLRPKLVWEARDLIPAQCPARITSWTLRKLLQIETVVTIGETRLHYPAHLSTRVMNKCYRRRLDGVICLMNDILVYTKQQGV